VYGENKVAFTVTGVYADLPENTELRQDYLLPMNSFSAITGWTDYEKNFWAYTFYTYVLLKENANPSTVDAKIYDALKDYRKEHHPYLRPLSKLHLTPFFEHDYIVAMGLLYLIALLILVLSAINFINLQTANATNRFREIGIKKTVGFFQENTLDTVCIRIGYHCLTGPVYWEFLSRKWPFPYSTGYWDILFSVMYMTTGSYC